MKTLISAVTILLLLSFITPAESQINFGSNKKVGKYVDVNDIKVYYEIYGGGQPLLLLHGNSGSIENFIYQIPELSKKFKVIAVDSRAQGRSTDSDKEITHALMASDMSELIDKLNLRSVYVVGWSDGGIVGLELAFAHPEKVKKLVAFGANWTHENYTAPPDSVVMDTTDPRFLKLSIVLKKYKEGIERLSPAARKKLADLRERSPNFTKEQLKQIRMPVLIVAGDHDAVSLEHTNALFTSLPHSQLFVVPGASHGAPGEQPELVNREVIRFLSTPYRDIDRYYLFKFLK